jgi:uncharacterized protein YwqG
MSQIDFLRDAIQKCGLSKHSERILRYARPCVRVRASNVPGGTTLAANASQFAGPVHLLTGETWPMAGNWPMMQLAQLRLSDVAPHDHSGVLPKHGLLKFWYDMEEMPWGFDPANRNGFRVEYHPDESATMSLTAPPSRFSSYDTEDGSLFRACTLSFVAGITVPHSSWADFGDERDGLMELSGYEDLLQLIGQSGTPSHRLLGQPNLIQHPMEGECQLASNGVNCGGATEPDPKRVDELTPGIADWMLLFQIDTDEDESGPGWMWGDCGTLYFWIRRQDLAAKRFDNCWQVLQCS